MTKNIYQKTIIAFLIISFVVAGANYSLAANNSAIIPSGDKESQISWAKERQEKLLKLMETNPQSVIDQSLPQKEITKMPSYVKPYMEEVKTVSGTVFATIQDNFEQKTFKTSYVIKSGTERLPLYFAGEKPNLESGVKITIKNAARVGNKIVVPASADLQKYSQTSRPQSITGSKKAAIILFNFQNKTDEPFTKEKVRAKVYDDANNYYKEISFNKLSISGYNSSNGEQDVYGWYTISNNASDCEYYSWTDAAKKIAAEKNNFKENNYSNIMYFFPHNDNCLWSGLGDVGSLTSNNNWTYETLFNGTTSPYVIAHELGHNFGAIHASSYTCYDVNKNTIAISNDCTASKYGDPFDVMGTGTSPNHMSSLYKTQMGWLDSQNVQNVEENGTFTLFPIEKKSSGIQAIKIPRGTYSESADYDDYYFLEYRRPYGYDTFSENDAVVNGVSIRLVKSYAPANNEDSYLIDTTPFSNNNYNEHLDGALLTGKTFKDDIANIEIKTINVSAESAEVEIKTSYIKVPETPANFQARIGECGSKSIELTWNDVENESFYKLNRRGSDGDETITISQNITSYIDKNVKEGYTYYYELKACNNSGCSDAIPADPVKVPSECQIFKTLTIEREGNGFGKITIINKSDKNKKTVCDLSSKDTNKCEFQYPEKSKLKLQAQKLSGSIFKKWTGGCSGTSKICNITLTSDKIIWAKFVVKNKKTNEEIDTE